ncbi:hypothetical protein [Streptomyces sp. LUP30]|nr:hypothetical protein [Streptomyces sp. LUP30]
MVNTDFANGPASSGPAVVGRVSSQVLAGSVSAVLAVSTPANGA